jgi:hypothetical protein
MAELGWPASEVTQEHLQNLVSQGYMTAVELATCRVPEDLTFLAPVWGDTPWLAWHSTSGIWYAITSISPLPAVVIRLGAASLDSFRDHSYVPAPLAATS